MSGLAGPGAPNSARFQCVRTARPPFCHLRPARIAEHTFGFNSTAVERMRRLRAERTVSVSFRWTAVARVLV